MLLSEKSVHLVDLWDYLPIWKINHLEPMLTCPMKKTVFPFKNGLEYLGKKQKMLLNIKPIIVQESISQLKRQV